MNKPFTSKNIGENKSTYHMLDLKLTMLRYELKTFN